MNKIYADIQEAGDKLFDGKYGCQILKWADGESEESIKRMMESEPEGLEVHTNLGIYWIWKSEE